ncbi:SDR family oxidoreductase [Sphingomicrobium aestuariivivum]|uniref:SDR family oxidoreductase n=1 Tax=Sphingomicrobium aestuariivivum TaxID=1582356 RepID=UPI001FD6CFCF|nr:SDR family oxidoreductase [Sphingomicrobium aestuariivivum]MCJ8190205.1 SDR family oxidoreductase [Sphingomicrobium aestuariivivum]
MPALTRRQLMQAAAAAGVAASLPGGAVAQGTGLAGKRILITGCSSGFGNLTALHFARAGATVYATMRNMPRAEAAALQQVADTEGLDLRLLALDVLRPHEVTGTAAKVAEDGGLDILVNNAGIGITGPVEVQDEEAIRLQFDTNVMGYHRVARAFLPMMREAGSGHLFFVSSQLGRVIAPGAGHYCATKFAVEAMAEQLAYEIQPHGLGVTILQPGGYPTEIWKNRNIYNSALKERIEPVHAAGYPEMVARMGTEDGSGRNADPMDIPRAIAEIAMLPAAERPLRRAIHPGTKPQMAINRVSAETQLSWVGQSQAWGPAVQSVLTPLPPTA